MHEDLWKENLGFAQSCMKHPFVMGLVSGSLDKDSFKQYIAQDAFFLRAFRKAFALAIAKCDDIRIAKTLHGLMAGVLTELNLHEEYSKSLGINLQTVVPLKECRAYTDFLLRTAWQGNLAEIMAAMAPCMVLYSYLGNALKEIMDPQTPYKNWIETYASDSMKELAHKMETLLDAIPADEKEQQSIHAAYRYAMQCELDFFSGPLRK